MDSVKAASEGLEYKHQVNDAQTESIHVKEPTRNDFTDVPTQVAELVPTTIEAIPLEDDPNFAQIRQEVQDLRRELKENTKSSAENTPPLDGEVAQLRQEVQSLRRRGGAAEGDTSTRKWCLRLVIVIAVLAAVGGAATVLIRRDDSSPSTVVPPASTAVPTNLRPTSSPSTFTTSWDCHGYSADTRRIESISTGSLPTCLGELTELTSIGLGAEKLGGTIPTEIGLIKKLARLQLFENSLTGSFPTEIGLLTSLTLLAAQTNRLTGSIPTEIGQIKAMAALRLFENQLMNVIPTEIGLMTSLTVLSLANNELKGTIPSELGKLTALTGIWLFDNQLTGSMPSELEDLVDLNTLWLQNNSMTGTIPTWVSSISDTNIAGNNFTEV